MADSAELADRSAAFTAADVDQIFTMRGPSCADLLEPLATALESVGGTP